MVALTSKGHEEHLKSLKAEAKSLGYVLVPEDCIYRNKSYFIMRVSIVPPEDDNREELSKSIYLPKVEDIVIKDVSEILFQTIVAGMKEHWKMEN